jgi:hypothetical protein
LGVRLPTLRLLLAKGTRGNSPGSGRCVRSRPVHDHLRERLPLVLVRALRSPGEGTIDGCRSAGGGRRSYVPIRAFDKGRYEHAQTALDIAARGHSSEGGSRHCLRAPTQRLSASSTSDQTPDERRVGISIDDLRWRCSARELYELACVYLRLRLERLITRQPEYEVRNPIFCAPSASKRQ